MCARSVQLFEQQLDIMQLCLRSTGRRLVERRFEPVDSSSAQTQKMKALLKAEATLLPQQSASEAGLTAPPASLCGQSMRVGVGM